MHAYPGSKPDVTQFPNMITQLKTRYEQCAPRPYPAQCANLTVVFDAGQTATRISAPAQAALSYVGSVPASDCPDCSPCPLGPHPGR